MYISSGFPQSSNAVAALRIDADGALTPDPGSPFATGSSNFPTGIAITPDGRNVYTANAFSNTVSAFSVDPVGGLFLVPGSPFAVNANLPFAAAPSPDGRFLYVANHFSHTIGVWAIDPTFGVGLLGQIPGSPFAVPMGQTGPFPVIAAPDGSHIYVPNENTDTVTAYAVAADGALSPIQTIATGNNPFGGAITPDGTFLYLSNPEPTPQPPAGEMAPFPKGAISAYAVGMDGRLTEIAGSPFDVAPGDHPLSMAIAPDGRFLFVATRVTNNVTVFAIAADGTLSQVSGSPFPTGGLNGRALALTPDGSGLYVSNTDSNNVSGFNVGADGALTSIPNSPFPTGVMNPFLESIVITPNQPPSAFFTVQTQPPGSATGFDGSGSVDIDGSVATFEWDFGDGSNRLVTGSPTTQHTYAAPGTYTVTLTVTDNEGCSVERIFTGKATLCNGTPVATGTSQVFVAPIADLSVTKTDSPDPLTVGDKLTYTVTITNNGPSDATGVILTDLLPHQDPEDVTFISTFISATPSQGTCSHAGGTVICDIGNLGSGNSNTVEIVVRPPAAGTIANLANVTSNETDPDNTNNNDTEVTTVSPPPVTCGGRTATIVGTPGNDNISGTPRRDVIHGLGGNDTIRGLGGDDVICGDTGQDTLSGGLGNDRLLGGVGNDRLFGGRGADALSGQGGNDTLDGGPQVDSCNGGPGKDTAVRCQRTINVP